MFFVDFLDPFRQMPEGFSNYVMKDSLHILSNSMFTDFPTIRRYAILAPDSLCKESAKNQQI